MRCRGRSVFGPAQAPDSAEHGRRRSGSPVLAGRSRQPLWVYLPPGYPDQTRRFPALYLLPGYGGSVASWASRPVFGQPVLQVIDEAFATGRAPQAVVVSVDGWTRYGGSQYIDSNGTGRYHSYLCDEIVRYVDDRYRTITDRDHRAVLGRSSGGFGALVACMLRPDVFSGCASHAGDLLRDCLPAPPARSRAGLAPLGRRHHGLVEGLPGSLARRAPRRAHAPVRPRRLGMLLARPWPHTPPGARPRPPLLPQRRPPAR